MARSARFVVTVGACAAALAGAGASRAAPVAGPSPLLPFSTFLGGEGDDAAGAAAFGEDGALWIAAESSSKALPGAVRSGKVDPEGDVVVLRMDPTTHEVLSSAWIGGDERDFVVALAPAPGGGAFVLGRAGGDRFPSTTDWAIHSYPGPNPPFLARVRADGRGFDWSAVLDPGLMTYAAALAVTPEGDPVVVGGGSDGARIARFAADGSRIVHSRRLANWSRASAVAVAPDGTILVGGQAYTMGLDGALRLRPAGAGASEEGFVAEIDASGTQVLRTAALGDTLVAAVALAGDGVLVLGSTERPWLATKPPDPADTPGGVLFLRLDAEWKIAAQRPFGGSGQEWDLSMTAAGDGKVWIAGTTTSADLPLFRPVQPLLGSEQDAFVAQFDAADLAPLFATCLGGRAADVPRMVAVADDGAGWLVGSTQSSDFPVADAEQSGLAAAGDAFVARFVPTALEGAPPAAPVGLAAEVLGARAVRLRWSVDAGAAQDVVVYRREKLGGFARAAVLPATTTEWTDSTVLPLRRYAYAVQATGASGGSSASPVAEASTPGSLDLRIFSGRLDFVPRGVGRGTRLQLKGGVQSASAPGSGGFDPRRDGVSWTLIAREGEDFAGLSIPAGDPHWRRTRRGLRWTRRGSRVEFDPATGLFDVRTTFRRVGVVPIGDRDGVRVSLGEDAALLDLEWRVVGPRRMQTVGR